MLLLYLSLQQKDPGIYPGFFPRLMLYGYFKEKKPQQLNLIKNHGVLVYRCTYLLLTSG